MTPPGAAEAQLDARSDDRLDWDKVAGLIPVVVQDARTGRVLMVAYMNREALAKTRATGQVTFFSRSKNRLWTKGETSGHVLDLVDITADCDGDALLVRAIPRGPTCHLGNTSCFADPQTETRDHAMDFLAQLDAVVAQRQRDMPEGSYTSRLFTSGIGRMAQKVGEEGVEVALAAKDPGSEDVVAEAADLIYHLIVLLRAKNTDLAAVVRLLEQRHAH